MALIFLYILSLMLLTFRNILYTIVCTCILLLTKIEDTPWMLKLFHIQTDQVLLFIFILKVHKMVQMFFSNALLKSSKFNQSLVKYFSAWNCQLSRFFLHTVTIKKSNSILKKSYDVNLQTYKGWIIRVPGALSDFLTKKTSLDITILAWLSCNFIDRLCVNLSVSQLVIVF